MNPDQKYKLAVIEIVVIAIITIYSIHGNFSRLPESFALNLKTTNFQVEMSCEFDE